VKDFHVHQEGESPIEPGDTSTPAAAPSPASVWPPPPAQRTQPADEGQEDAADDQSTQVIAAVRRPGSAGEGVETPPDGPVVGEAPAGQVSGAGPARYVFTVPETEPHIEFKKVRRGPAATPDAGSPGARTSGGRRRKRRRLSLLVAIVAGVLIVGSSAVAFRGVLAADHLQAAARLVTRLQQEIARGDADTARRTLARLRAETGDARSDTSDPAWGLASRTPRIGDDLTALRTVSSVLSDLSEHGLPPLVDLAVGINDALVGTQRGRVDLAALTTAGPRLTVTEAAILNARARVGAIPVKGLTPSLRAAVRELRGGLARADHLMDTATRMAALLPPMLGANGRRTYMVLFQNLAEARATGGMPGAFIVVAADQGRISLVDQGSASSDLRRFPSPVLPLDPDMVDLYTERPGIFPADVNLSPDFPTAARLVRQMYFLRTGHSVDGVFATDPVALSYVLNATGPVPMPAGAPLTADTVVSLLLQKAYASMTSSAQKDAYFATAAKATFEALTHVRGGTKGLLTQLARSAGERRILAWSAHPEEESAFNGTVLAGQLPVDDGTSPTVGVFLNDGSGSKMSYYLTHSARLSVGSCQDDGSVELHLRITLGSTAPPSGLPQYVLGLALSGNPYTIRTNVMVFSPTGGSLEDATVNGAEADMGTGAEGGRKVGVLTIDLPPGVTKTIDVTLLTDVLPTQAGISPQLRTTPGVVSWPTSIAEGPGCSK
jgi:hypothetical protein